MYILFKCGMSFKIDFVCTLQIKIISVCFKIILLTFIYEINIYYLLNLVLIMYVLHVIRSIYIITCVLFK